MINVAILGTGPAGLMAAYAALLQPRTSVRIFSRDRRPSLLGGAQFLHRGLPGTIEPDAMIRYKLVGSHTGYREKVYGDFDVPFVSMQNVRDGEEVPAWSLRETYRNLWETIVKGEEAISVVNITPQWIIDRLEASDFDLIVSTIPRKAICLAHAGITTGRPHSFYSQSVRIMNASAFDLEDNTILYDGTKNVSWYRTAKIFGVGSTEWGESAPDRLPYEAEIVRATKPILTDCTCFEGRVVFAGRYGEWRKGALSHDAFEKTTGALS